MSGAVPAVVVPVLNRPRTVLDALASVLAQSRRPSQVVVVDDGSTDDPVAAIRTWLDQREDAHVVRLVRQAHAGAAAARNTGLDLVRASPYVAFLDSDDLWPEDFLERTARTLDACRTAVAASCDRLHGSPAALVVDDLAVLGQQPTRWLFANGGGVLSCSLLRTDTVRALGGFQANLVTGHDSELLLRLSTRGSWRHCPGDPVAFRRGIAHDRGERDHIRSACFDYKRRWALIHERFALEQCAADGAPTAFWRRGLARRWSQAGRQLSAAGRTTAARACFKRSLRWQTQAKTLLRIGATYFKGSGVRARTGRDAPHRVCG